MMCYYLNVHFQGQRVKQWSYWSHLTWDFFFFFTENRKISTNTICGQNLVFFVLILAVNIVTAGLERVTDYICGNYVANVNVV